MVNADARQPGLHSSMAGRIRAAMATHRVTMKGLSKEAGIPYGTLQGYLLERHPMPAEALGKIAEILDVSADWLISRSEEHTSELQSLMRISYAGFCLTKKTNRTHMV